ncbi:hypothetical protein E2C01_031256 [Portunus trituberculatus]|uniref:Uncharacterized protein n=1 Tax=Portunus trituberculatus TaxID=210409 RepID=A0A5B7EX67_PORTR|nr:hypothetical protein [Portunus trituberculatus]
MNWTASKGNHEPRGCLLKFNYNGQNFCHPIPYSTSSTRIRKYEAYLRSSLWTRNELVNGCEDKWGMLVTQCNEGTCHCLPHSIVHISSSLQEAPYQTFNSSSELFIAATHNLLSITNVAIEHLDK